LVGIWWIVPTAVPSDMHMKSILPTSSRMPYTSYAGIDRIHAIWWALISPAAECDI
jgi:hypothetical protein